MNDLNAFIGLLDLPVRNEPLLQRALTHSSWINELNAEDPAETDNERLEFLGDAVLDLIVGRHLFEQFPMMGEGEMTELRAALVKTETLAEFALQLKINQFLQLGYGEDESGGRLKTTTLCAAFEAVIGALYMDVGLDALTPLVLHLIKPTLAHIIKHSLHKDPKSEFQAFAQATFGHTPTYKLVGQDGPAHDRTFTLQLFVADEMWGEGRGTSKRRAAVEAARTGLIRAGVPGWS